MFSNWLFLALLLREIAFSNILSPFVERTACPWQGIWMSQNLWKIMSVIYEFVKAYTMEASCLLQDVAPLISHHFSCVHKENKTIWTNQLDSLFDIYFDSFFELFSVAWVESRGAGQILWKGSSGETKTHADVSSLERTVGHIWIYRETKFRSKQNQTLDKTTGSKHILPEAKVISN